MFLSSHAVTTSNPFLLHTHSTFLHLCPDPWPKTCVLLPLKSVQVATMLWSSLLSPPFGAHTTWNLNIHHFGGGGMIGRAYWQKTCSRILSPPLASYIWHLGVSLGLGDYSFIYIWNMNQNSCPPYLHEVVAHFNVQMLIVHILEMAF